MISLLHRIHPNRWLIWTVVIAVVVAIVLVWTIAIFSIEKEFEISPDQITLALHMRLRRMPVASVPDANRQLDTSNWLTYRNEKYGFEFKYPTSLDFQETTSEISLKNYFSAKFYDKKRNIFLEVYTDNGENSKYLMQRVQEIGVGENRNIVYSTEINNIDFNVFDDYSEYGTYFSYKTYFITLRVTDLELMKKILSTLKFFEPTGQ